MLLANAGDNASVIQEFLQDAHTTLPSLMDQQQSTYQSYVRAASFAPFPLQVVVDQEGTIRYLAFQYEAEAVRQAIDSLLEE